MVFKKIATVFFLFIISVSVSAQNSLEAYYKSIQANEPSVENPYGLRNPKAPDALSEFDFMLGECHCTDSVTNADGTYRVYPSIWKAKYMLNGHAIQDNNFNPINPTTNLRMYDAAAKLWKVTYLQSANGYFTGVWEGNLDDNGDMVLERKQNGSTSRLVFYNISDKGYAWKSESIGPDEKVTRRWKKDCVRQK